MTGKETIHIITQYAKEIHSQGYSIENKIKLDVITELMRKIDNRLEEETDYMKKYERWLESDER